MRNLLPLAVGLAVGIAGTILFVQSMPAEAGSAEARAQKLEAELKRVNNRVASLEAESPQGRRQNERTVRDGARSIAEDIRDGKPVTPDDVFRAAKPFIRDVSPLFSRMRELEIQKQTDAMAGEYARKYSLTEPQQTALKEWLNAKAIEDAKAYTDLLARDSTTLKELGEATYNMRMDDGLDAYMANTLSGSKLAAFKADRMLEKVERVQNEADRKVERLDNIVKLDDTQRGQIFGMMARGSRDYDPGMQFEGTGTEKGSITTGKPQEEAILAVLKPEQREAYHADRVKRKAEAQEELSKMGMTLPEDWDEGDRFDY